MYQIYADSVLIYDSTLEDYKIGKGEIVREVDKSGSFVFSVYPDHFYYNEFIQMKTVITVYKSGRIVFRGRVLNDVTDYWNNKVLTCEGELGFLQDTIVRPYEFQGSPTSLLRQFVEAHNAQVDEFKQFRLGTVNIDDANDYVNRSSTDYATTLDMMQSALPGSDLGGHFYITHGEDGTDPIPTLHYLQDFPDTSTQDIEFGVNLKDYTKTAKAEEVATAIIPLGTNNSTTGERLTIADVNGGVDFLYDETAVALRGWIFKPVIWEDVTLANHLLTKARAYLADVVKQNITIELNAIDLHLLDRSIASFNVCEYVRVISDPHHLDAVMLCNRQTMNLLQPENDTIVLGYATTSLTGANTQLGASVSTLGKQVSSIKQDATAIELQVQDLSRGVSSSLRVSADGVTITDADGEAVTISGSQIDASTIKTEQLDASKINVADMNLTGAISFGDLDASTQQAVGQAVSDANDASNAVKAWSYTGTTLIDGSKIQTGTVMASMLAGGAVQLLNYYGVPVGYLTMDGSYTADFNVALASGGSLRLTADYGDVFLRNGGNQFLQLGGGLGRVIVGGGSLAPNYSGSLSCGVAGAVWADVYAANATIQTSDLTVKKDVTYGLENYEALFDALRPISFRFVDGNSGRVHLGMGAQDVEQALADTGLTSMDFAGLIKLPKLDDEGNVVEGEFDYALRYGEFIPLLIEQVQQLKKRVRELEGEKNG